MPARRIAVSLALASFVAYGQALLDDATIGKLVKAGVAEQTIVAMIDQQPGNYALSSEDTIALRKAGVSENILAAMMARNGTGNSSPATPAAAPPAGTNQAIIPVALALRDATPIRLRLTRDLSFMYMRPGDQADFEILDDLRIDGVLVIARGGRATANITEVEPKTRMGRGGRLGVTLDSVSLLNGDNVAIRVAKDGHGGRQTGGATVAAEAVGGPPAPSLLFTFDKDDPLPEGTRISVYIDGEIKLDPAKFLVDVAFTSIPQGAQVNMYGAPIGRTPFTAKLAAGTYEAVFSAEGYYDLTQSVPVGPGHSNTVHAVFESKP